METLGIIRRIDDLGRIIIPKDLRKACDLKEGDALEIIIDKDKNIIMKKREEVEVSLLDKYNDKLVELKNKMAEAYIEKDDEQFRLLEAQKDLVEEVIKDLRK